MEKIMRKVVCLLMIFALSGALYAADVDFSAAQVPAGGNKVTISYVVNAGNSPTGIALVASVDSGVKITGSESQSASFNVNPDHAYGDPCNYTLGTGHPLAEPCAPGVATLPSSEVSICMGIVDPCDSHGPASDDIITLTLDPCGATAATLRVREDGYRGGVVGSPLDTNLGIRVDLVFTGGECYTGPDYAAWVQVGSPTCWCYERQCHGDTNNSFAGKDQDGKREYVELADLQLLGEGWGEVDSAGGTVGSWICADFNHSFAGKDQDGKREWVELGDLQILGFWWGDVDCTSAPPACGPPADCLTANPYQEP
jgi:hypothetical protein